MTLCIFEMSSINARRFNPSLEPQFDEIVCLVDDPECYFPDDTFSCEVCCGGWSISQLKRFLMRNNITQAVISGQRIADFRFTLAAKEANVKVVYQMHGLYIPHMKREFGFYLSKLKKSFRTARYAVDIGVWLRSFAMSFWQIGNFVFGNVRSKIMRFRELHPDHAIVWSQYWVEWHREHYQFPIHLPFSICGNPDTMKFSHRKQSGVVQYIYQTLVEDGRIAEQDMLDYYNRLKASATQENLTVVVKWHPRGNLHFRAVLGGLGFEITDDLIEQSTWCGHYSSLLGLGPLLGSNVIVHELIDHPTPFSIAQIAQDIQPVLRSDDGTLALKSNNAMKLKAAQYYFGPEFDQSAVLEQLVESHA